MKTKLYKHIPGDQGVASTLNEDEIELPCDTDVDPSFPGYSDIKIKSREHFINQLTDFINLSKKHAKGTTAYPIIGEWGQGKTDSYFRFIKPYVESKGDYAFYVSTSTLSRTYKNKDNVADKTNLISLKFLASLFEGIRSESRCENSKNLPILEGYPDPDTYIRDILGDLTEKNNKKIFIFLDEFEEILNQKEEILRDIISGIKETINGNYQLIHHQGDYKASIHIFIGITPDALYKLRTMEGTEEIFGGLLRRLNAIELKGINRKESIFYLKGLLEDSYEKEMPDPYPIENYGLFNTLFKISQKNIGNIRKLYTTLFNSLENEGMLEVLDYQNLLEFLERNKVFVYGAQAPCIEKDTYYRILDYLDEQKNDEDSLVAVEIFKILLADYKPTDVEYLSNRLDKDKNLILRGIKIVNSNINENEQIKNSILTVSPLKNDKKIEDIKELFQRDIEFDETAERYELVLGDIKPYREYLDEFIDRITFFDLDNNNNELISKIYLPFEETDTKMFFKNEISPEKAREISSKFKDLVDNKIEYLSNELVQNLIYPTPIPRDLNFIKDKEAKLEIWRDVLKNLTEYYEKYTSEAFLKALINSEIYTIQKIDQYDNYSTIFELIEKQSKSNIKTLLYSINGDVKADDVNVVSSILSDDIGINLAILLTGGDFSKKASELLGNNNKILGIHVHPNISKTLICTVIAPEKYAGKIDDILLKSVSKKIIQKDFLLDEKIDNWLDMQLENGLVIEQIETSAKTVRNLADCLKLYINYENTPYTSKEILEKNQNEILGFKKYKAKMTGLIGSDFEGKIVEELSVDLYANGFLNKKNSKYNIKEHPVINRLEKLFDQERKITIEDLNSSFIIREKNKKVLEDLFLDLLVYKGKIELGKKKKGEKTNYVLVNKDVKINTLKKDFKSFKEFVNKDKYKSAGHIFVSKERDNNIIFLEDLYNFITNLFDSIEDLEYSHDDEELSKKVYLADKLIEYFDVRYKKDIKAAFDTENQYHEVIEAKMLELRKEFIAIDKNSLNRLNIQFKGGIDSIQEYRKLKNYYDEFNVFYCEEIDKNKIISIRDNLKPDEIMEFKFDVKPSKNANYFSLRLFKLERLKNKFESAANAIQIQLLRNNQSFKTINDDISTLKKQFDMIRVDKKYRISYKLYNDISLAGFSKNGDVSLVEDIKLSELEVRTESKINKIRGDLKDIIISINSVEETLDEEIKLLKAIEEYKENIDKNKDILDLDWLQVYVQNFQEDLLRIETEYIKSDPLDLKKQDKKTSFFVQKWRNNLKSMYNKGIIDVWTYFISKIQVNILKTEKSIKTVKQIQKNAGKDFKEEDKEKIDVILNNLEKIKEMAKKPLKEQQPASLTKNMILENQNNWRNILDKYLDKYEQQLLDIIEELSSNSEWIDFDDISEKALTDGIDEKTLKNSLDELVSKKYIQKGFSIL